jgi:hypothetical protein
VTTETSRPTYRTRCFQRRRACGTKTEGLQSDVPPTPEEPSTIPIDIETAQAARSCGQKTKTFSMGLQSSVSSSNAFRTVDIIGRNACRRNVTMALQDPRVQDVTGGWLAQKNFSLPLQNRPLKCNTATSVAIIGWNCLFEVRQAESVGFHSATPPHRPTCVRLLAVIGGGTARSSVAPKCPEHSALMAAIKKVSLSPPKQRFKAKQCYNHWWYSPECVSAKHYTGNLDSTALTASSGSSRPVASGFSS